MAVAAPVATLGALTRHIHSFLAGAFRGDDRADAAGLDARLIVAAAAAVAAEEVVVRGERTIAPAAAERAWALARQRAAGVPVARLTGRKGFWSLDLAVGPAVLVPRPDTETVVAAALRHLRPGPASPRLLDLGTGSGAILLALLAELPDAEGIGVDRDPAALRIARFNAVSQGFGGRARFLAGDWTAPIVGRFDAIAANPPYIETETIATLAEEVRVHDPRLALDGGVDGLDAYRRIVPAAAPLLAPGGGLFLEVGAGQANRVAGLAATAGLAVARHRDLAGIERVVAGIFEGNRAG